MQDKVLAVTGASSGIGACFLRQAASKYSSILTFGRSGPNIEHINHTHHTLDLKKSVSAQLQGSDTPEKIDALVLCAGSDVKGRTDFLSQEFSVWEDTILVNFLRSVELIHLLLPKVMESTDKTLIVVTSMNIEIPAQKCLAYTSAKTAMRSVLENLRLEYAAKGLRVIEICPSITKTNFALNRTQDITTAENFYSTFPSLLEAEDVAASMLWALEKKLSSAITKLEIQPTILSR